MFSFLYLRMWKVERRVEMGMMGWSEAGVVVLVVVDKVLTNQTFRFWWFTRFLRWVKLRNARGQ